MSYTCEAVAIPAIAASSSVKLLLQQETNCAGRDTGCGLRGHPQSFSSTAELTEKIRCSATLRDGSVDHVEASALNKVLLGIH